MSENISVLLAFGAGLLSFLSPCVLPLIPSYLCVIGGFSSPASLENPGAYRPHLVARTAAFILGFSAVFIALSIVFAVAFSLMSGVSRWINLISGAVVILLGLHIIFDFFSFLNYEKRPRLTASPRGLAGAALAGAAFGAGWTPCVGPVLGSILLLAAQSGGVPQAALYLASYAAGLGIPFLLASLFFNTFMKTSVRLRRHLPLIRRVSGALLVVVGVLIVTGRYQALNALAAQWQNNKAAAAPPKTAAITKTAAPREDGAAIAANGFSAELVQAFNAAGLPVLKEGIATLDFTLPLLDGTSQSLAALRGQVVFLNFWATWCGPCRMEMPSMEAVYRRLKDRPFTILAVNLGERADVVSKFMREYNLTFPVALDSSGETGMLYGAQSIPTTYLIDKRGLFVSRIVGSIDWNEEKIIAAFEALLAE